jgi:mono/diheme cytochrome c family protein
VTEIPEHLLQRSRERRAALGGGGDAAPGGSSEAPAASESSSTEVEPAAAAAAPAPAAESAPVPAVVEEELSPLLVADQAIRRTRIPMWAVPVLVLLPFWAVLYAGAFGERGHEEVVDPAVLGPQVYAAQCAGCHGGAGEGASGPALASGAAVKTFPDEAAHVTWVQEGSIGKAKGTPYGAANREGGQRTVQVAGMPGFASTLSPAEIEAVVQFERESL